MQTKFDVSQIKSVQYRVFGAMSKLRDSSVRQPLFIDGNQHGKSGTDLSVKCIDYI